MIDLTNNPSTKNIKNFSKYLSYLLRHNPDSIGLDMDSEGWVNVDSLISRITDYKVNLDVLKYIVSTDNKQRYSFNNCSFTKIRANQGHSYTKVNIPFDKYKPLGVLYHGTSEDVIDDIFSSGGLKPMSRLYVHLSRDKETAIKVGKRHGNVKLLEIDAESMFKDGYEFYISTNFVILIKEVPSKYLSLLQDI